MDGDRAFSLYTATDDGDSSWAAPDVKEMHVESDMAAARQHLEDVSTLLSSLSQSRSVAEPALDIAHLAESTSPTEQSTTIMGGRDGAAEHYYYNNNKSSAASPAAPVGGTPIHSELSTLRAEVEELKQHHHRARAAENRDTWGNTEENEQKIAKLEAREKQHQTHVTTCLTTLHCLVSELRDIYDVQGVTAPHEASLAGSNGSSANSGVVSQLFGDIQRLFRALAFGVDGTLKDGDTLTAATLLENRDLRASLIGKEHELARRRAKDEEHALVIAALEEAKVKIRRLETESGAAARRSTALAEELAMMALQKGAEDEAEVKVEEQRRLYQDRAREWQSMIDKTVVESELTKAHANAVVELLASSHGDVAACKRQLAHKTQEIDGMRQTIRSLEADVANLQGDLQTAAFEKKLLNVAASRGVNHSMQPVETASPNNSTFLRPRFYVGSGNHDHTVGNGGGGGGATATAAAAVPTAAAYSNALLQDRVQGSSSNGGPSLTQLGAAAAAAGPAPQHPQSSLTSTNSSNAIASEGKDSWQAAAEILEHDRHLTQQELSQIDREISELQRSLADLSDSTASRLNDEAYTPA